MSNCALYLSAFLFFGTWHALPITANATCERNGFCQHLNGRLCLRAQLAALSWNNFCRDATYSSIVCVLAFNSFGFHNIITLALKSELLHFHIHYKEIQSQRDSFRVAFPQPQQYASTCSLHFAEKLDWKVLFTYFLWEKNTILPWLISQNDKLKRTGHNHKKDDWPAGAVYQC
jgi:hypothetical protein